MKLILILATFFSASLVMANPPEATLNSEIYYKKPVTFKKALSINPVLILNSSTFAGSDSGKSRSKFFPAIGLLTDIDINQDNLILETGVIYESKGAILPSNSMSTEANLTYFTVPVNFKWVYLNINNTKTYAKGGLVTSLLVAKEIAATMGNQRFSTSNFEAKSFDVAPTIGLGTLIGVSDNLNLILEASYSRGLLSVIDKAELFNSTFAFTAGLNFTQP